MAILLGIDTGGTYTDAVLYDDTAPHPGILAKAKALTTKQDLSIGIAGAVDTVLAEGADPGAVGLVSISTTLATNALVEGQGGRICLILIGFDQGALSRAGLAEAVGTDPVAFVAGGHTPHGERQAPLDRAGLAAVIEEHKDQVGAFAVVAYFGTRDPVDEIAAREMIGAATDRPVTCGHELASALNGPKRALTAVLNARLIAMIARLISATEAVLAARGIAAPLMLVRGDGSLVSAGFAKSRPIETILSGPAASLIGAAHLTGARNAVVSDIGGTTTDIALLSEGRPALSPEGATVGGHATMVEAVAMTTHGLGGDSEVHLAETGLEADVSLGPRRVLPVSLLAAEHPEAVHAVLDTQLAKPVPGPLDARFVRAVDRGAYLADPKDQRLFAQLTEIPQPVANLLRNRADHAVLRRLVARGVAQLSGFTPSDAAHVLGELSRWDGAAAEKAAALTARRRDGSGRPIAPDTATISRMVVDALVRRSAEVLLEAALAHDGFEGADLARTVIARAALDGHTGAARLDIGLRLPLVGLGASAPLYYPAIAERLGAEPLIPEHAGVANAIGAVVGMVRLSAAATVTTPSDGLFRVHDGLGTSDHPSLGAARDTALALLTQRLARDAQAAGAVEVEFSETWDEKSATIEGKPTFIEGTATVTATGRPGIA